jgi:NAD(P)H-quinone oxidoreductase subunit 5
MVQPDVKRGLGASTSAQMGFMLMQCGLGFHAAAMAHLVLHGLYKASLFLGAGSGLAIAPRPAAPRLVDLGPALVAAILGGAGFAIVTGKFFNDTGAILVLFAAMAAAQASLAAPATGAMRWAGVPAALGVAGVLYGLLVLAIEALLSGMPGLTAPQDFTTLHLIIVDLFVIAWLAVLAGLHRRSAALYVRVLGLSQPAASAVTDRREAYHA